MISNVMKHEHLGSFELLTCLNSFRNFLGQVFVEFFFRLLRRECFYSLGRGKRGREQKVTNHDVLNTEISMEIISKLLRCLASSPKSLYINNVIPSIPPCWNVHQLWCFICSDKIIKFYSAYKMPSVIAIIQTEKNERKRYNNHRLCSVFHVFHLFRFAKLLFNSYWVRTMIWAFKHGRL